MLPPSQLEVMYKEMAGAFDQQFQEQVLRNSLEYAKTIETLSARYATVFDDLLARVNRLAQVRLLLACPSLPPTGSSLVSLSPPPLIS